MYSNPTLFRGGLQPDNRIIPTDPVRQCDTPVDPITRQRLGTKSKRTERETQMKECDNPKRDEGEPVQ